MVLGPTARRWLPYLNFTVAVSALGFQTGVLYPWHEELDHEFKKLKEEHKQTLHMYHEAKLKRLEELEKKVAAERAAQRTMQLTNWMPWQGGEAASAN